MTLGFKAGELAPPQCSPTKHLILTTWVRMRVRACELFLHFIKAYPIFQLICSVAKATAINAQPRLLAWPCTFQFFNDLVAYGQ